MRDLMTNSFQLVMQCTILMNEILKMNQTTTKKSLIATIYKTHLGLRLGKKVPTIGRHFRR